MGSAGPTAGAALMLGRCRRSIVVFDAVSPRDVQVAVVAAAEAAKV